MLFEHKYYTLTKLFFSLQFRWFPDTSFSGLEKKTKDDKNRFWCLSTHDCAFFQKNHFNPGSLLLLLQWVQKASLTPPNNEKVGFSYNMGVFLKYYSIQLALLWEGLLRLKRKWESMMSYHQKFQKLSNFLTLSVR